MTSIINGICNVDRWPCTSMICSIVLDIFNNLTMRVNPAGFSQVYLLFSTLLRLSDSSGFLSTLLGDSSAEIFLLLTFFAILAPCLYSGLPIAPDSLQQKMNTSLAHKKVSLLLSYSASSLSFWSGSVFHKT